ncbi:MAG: efflux transporter outer membrane subunit [Burkholderiaceae bacterium]|nr:efflux transporter outer membrane subunit [Burkholderiaceae bacterium]
MNCKPPLPHRMLLPLLVGAVLSACASAPPPPPAPPTVVPAAWSAPLPHNGDPARLQDWWRQWNDPVLLELIVDAQAVSADLTEARARLAQAQAAQIAATAAGRPQVDGSLQAARATTSGPAGPGGPPATQAAASLLMNWELDLWGGQQAGRDAADARVDASAARWHDARVAVAAEVARARVSLRHCERSLALTRADVEARGALARLSTLRAQAGLEAPAATALLTASAAQGRAEQRDQQTRCASERQGLAALTGWSLARLDQRLAGQEDAPQPAGPPIPQRLPAEQLQQRPDLRAADREWLAARADVGVADAARYPRLTLSGQIGRVGQRGTGGDATTWSLGPLQLSLPLVDGGRRDAEAQAARVRLAAAAARYEATARQAVREVEQALLAHDGASARQADVREAADGFRRALAATESRHRAGLASAQELEEARRAALAAQQSVLTWELEQKLAWIALYRAMGGGWTPAEPSPALPVRP